MRMAFFLFCVNRLGDAGHWPRSLSPGARSKRVTVCPFWVPNKDNSALIRAVYLNINDLYPL